MRNLLSYKTPPIIIFRSIRNNTFTRLHLYNTFQVIVLVRGVCDVTRSSYDSVWCRGRSSRDSVRLMLANMYLAYVAANDPLTYNCFWIWLNGKLGCMRLRKYNVRHTSCAPWFRSDNIQFMCMPTVCAVGIRMYIHVASYIGSGCLQSGQFYGLGPVGVLSRAYQYI